MRSLEQKTTITIIDKDGNVLKLSEKEYKKRFNANGKKAAKVEAKPKKEISVVAEEVEGILSKIKVLKSVQAYRNNAYRAWGTIANEILAHNSIRKPMTQYCTKFSELNNLIDNCKNLAKRNEKAIFQYIEKMAWKLEDMKEDITAIMIAVNTCGVCQVYKKHEAINGKDKRLGLATVVRKCYESMEEIEKAIKHLQELSDKGVDPMNYEAHMSYTSRKRCGLA